MESLHRMVNMNQPKTLRYLVVVELIVEGYAVAMFHSQEEAESLAYSLVTLLTLDPMSPASQTLRPFRPIARYPINGNAYFITSMIWQQNTKGGFIYIVGIHESQGGLQGFIGERQNCSQLFTLGDHIDRFDRAMDMFEGFVFLAN
jgi:hypothetical protein